MGQNEILESSRELRFTVQDPKLQGSHWVYTCSGVDSKGDWSGQRRFKEFAALHEKLEQNWPGMPVPTLPAKGMGQLDNSNKRFIDQRRHHLEQYLKRLSAYEYLVESEEFQTFSRPTGDIEKSLKALRKQTYPAIVKKYQTIFGIEVHAYDHAKKQQFEERCAGYTTFSKRML